MIFKRYENKTKFPKTRLRNREYKSPVVIWNEEGKGIFYDRSTKQSNISKK